MNMENLFFETQGINNYLSYRIAADDELDTMSVGMLTNNHIPGLAATSFVQMDLDRIVKYNISTKVSVAQLFSGPVNKKHLLGIFSGIVDALCSAEDYMLDPGSLLFDLKYIFFKPSTGETAMICVPILGNNAAPDLSAFFRNLIVTVQPDLTENADHIGQILSHLNSRPAFDLPEFKQLLEKLAGTKEEGPKHVVISAQKVVAPVEKQVLTPPQKIEQNVTPTPLNKVTPPVSPIPPVSKPIEQEASAKPKKSGFFSFGGGKKEKEKVEKQPDPSVLGSFGFAVPGAPSTPQPPVTPPVQPSKPVQSPVTPAQPPVTPAQPPVTPAQPPVTPMQSPKPAQHMVIGETTVLGGAANGQTTVLTQNPVAQVRPHLIRVKNNEKINLDKAVFRIGREKSCVDYFIGDNSTISSNHANIISRDGAYFVVDTNSTNHTWVNDQMIPSNVETKVEHGSKIRLANEEFKLILR